MRRAAAARRTSIGGALLACSISIAGCGPADAPSGAGGAGIVEDRNLLLVTWCGARIDQVDAALSDGALPALAALTRQGGETTRFRSAHVDCRAAHRDRLQVASDGIAPRSAAAFLSRGELTGLLCERWPGSTEDGPRLERFSIEIDGPDAVPTALRRDVEATVAAALAWLSRATTPFAIWVQVDAMASESIAPGSPADRAGLTAAARDRLLAADRALARLLEELRRAGRDRRTRVIVATDHGEAWGEAGAVGPRSAHPSATGAFALVADPGANDLPLFRDAIEPPAPAELAPDLDVRERVRVARGERQPDLSPAARIREAEAACSLAPWYFPAFRALATLRQQQGDPRGALEALDDYARRAPLAPAAREAFERLHAATRARLERGLPGGARR
jgi:hypothetical protein